MNTEQQKIEYKSLQKIRTGEKGFKELSTTCVALANAQGGQIMIGVEDKTKKPAPNQVIPQEEANSAVTRLRGLCFNVGLSVVAVFICNCDDFLPDYSKKLFKRYSHHQSHTASA